MAPKSQLARPVQPALSFLPPSALHCQRTLQGWPNREAFLLGPKSLPTGFNQYCMGTLYLYERERRPRVAEFNIMMR